MPENLLENLNKEQLAAVMHDKGPLMIIAGAGTGKTTVITHRIGWLIEQGKAKADEILALTFTEKAAAEMEERVDRTTISKIFFMDPESFFAMVAQPSSMAIFNDPRRPAVQARRMIHPELSTGIFILARLSCLSLVRKQP